LSECERLRLENGLDFSLVDVCRERDLSMTKIKKAADGPLTFPAVTLPIRVLFGRCAPGLRRSDSQNSAGSHRKSREEPSESCNCFRANRLLRTI